MPPGLAKPRYVGEGNGLAKILLTGQRAVGIFRPVWLFRFAISSVSSFRIVCRSASSFDVLRSRWYRRMFSSCTKSCKFITCFSVRIACEAVCWGGISTVSRCASPDPKRQSAHSASVPVRMPSMSVHPGFPRKPFMLGPTDRAVRTGKEHRHGRKPRGIHLVLGLNPASCFRASDHEHSHPRLHPSRDCCLTRRQMRYRLRRAASWRPR